MSAALIIFLVQIIMWINLVARGFVSRNHWYFFWALILFLIMGCTFPCKKKERYRV